MIKLKNLIPESVRTAGIFKAIFMSGIPGSGKSYVIKNISDGQISPKIVNTDTFIEYISSVVGYDINSKDFDVFRDKVKKLTTKQIALYINGVLPLFVDGTSNRLSNLFRRDGILKSFGYDTGMVWINTKLDVAIRRAKLRTRQVPEEFIKQVFDSLIKNKNYYKSHFKFFIEVDNSDGELTDSVVLKSLKACNQFFLSPVENPIGTERIEKLQNSGGQLVPTIFDSISKIEKTVSSGWWSL